MVPLQYLNIVFLEIEAAGQHPRNGAIAFDFARAIDEFHHAAIFVVLGCALPIGR